VSPDCPGSLQHGPQAAEFRYGAEIELTSEGTSEPKRGPGSTPQDSRFRARIPWVSSYWIAVGSASSRCDGDLVFEIAVHDFEPGAEIQPVIYR